MAAIRQAHADRVVERVNVELGEVLRPNPDACVGREGVAVARGEAVDVADLAVGRMRRARPLFHRQQPAAPVGQQE